MKPNYYQHIMAAPSLNLAEKIEVLTAELAQKEHENLLLKEQLNQKTKEIKALEKTSAEKEKKLAKTKNKLDKKRSDAAKAKHELSLAQKKNKTRRQIAFL